MNYNKPALSINDQIKRLKARGLVINDAPFVENCLSNISYYRLRAYTYPFQDNVNPNHPFVVQVSFDKIIDLYVFDRELRLLVMDALEKIEIALRTQIIYQWALTNGSHWQIIPHLYRDPVRFSNQITNLQSEIDRSNETFIDHYKSTYAQPSEPPAWMSLEVSSFGLLSLMFLNLKKGPEKNLVTRHFGLNDVSVLENWMHCFCNIRNVCAHHGRLWNRRLTTHVKLPTNPRYKFLQNTNIYPYKLYAALSCMQYVLQKISPPCTFKDKLKALMQTCPLKQEKEMGFPSGWQNELLWKSI